MRNNVTQIAQQAIALYQQQKYEVALPLLKQLTAAGVSHPLIWHVFALCLRKLGKLQESEQAFCKAMKLAPNDAEIKNNYGNLLKQLGDSNKAMQCFHEALRCRPGFVDAQYNAGLLKLEKKQYAEASRFLKQALSNKPDFASAAVALAKSLIQTGDLDEAIGVLCRILEGGSDSVPVLLTLSQCYREKGLHDEAVELLCDRQESDLLVRELAINLHFSGRSESAIECFRALLKKDPLNQQVLGSMADIRWLMGDVDWLDDYYQALCANPNSWPLRCDLSNRLVKSEQLQSAEQILEESPVSVWPLEALLLKGHIKREQGEIEEAQHVLKKALPMSEKNTSVINELMLCHLSEGDVKSALRCCDQLIEKETDNQAWWAMKAACLKLAGNLREYRKLYDFDKFVKAYVLPCPSGYSNISEFNQQLLHDLQNMHASARHPLEQSLRTGTQTEGHLFRRDIESVKFLEKQLKQVIAAYISHLSFDNSHPFTRRLRQDFLFSGAWSVRLNNSGYHRNHYHSEGWISGSYYVSVPKAVQRSGNGWIKFGQAELGRLFSMDPDYCIKPEAGSVALFPSMMWHGTEPFDDQEYRVTVAFDVVPVEE